MLCVLDHFYLILYGFSWTVGFSMSSVWPHDAVWLAWEWHVTCIDWFQCLMKSGYNKVFILLWARTHKLAHAWKRVESDFSPNLFLHFVSDLSVADFCSLSSTALLQFLHHMLSQLEFPLGRFPAVKSCPYLKIHLWFTSTPYWTNTLCASTEK